MHKSLLYFLMLLPLAAASGEACAAVPDHAVVLIYHHVSTTAPASTSVSPDQFQDHLDHLAANGYQVVPLAAIVDSLQQGSGLPDKVVSLTFDDGYRSVYTEAFPRLQERGWPFTIFVCPDAVDEGGGPILTWDELREMAAAGATVANHGLTHDYLQHRRPGETSATWRERTRAELVQAQQRIAGEIGTVQPLFAYPYGEYSPGLQDLLAELGWAAFGQQSGPVGRDSDFTILPRFPMVGSFASMETFPVKVASLPLPVLASEPRTPQWSPDGSSDPDAWRPRLRITLRPGDYRVDQLAAYASEQGAAEIVPVDPDGLVFDVRCRQPLPRGRSRYNITAPATEGRRYFWYSHTWIVGERP